MSDSQWCSLNLYHSKNEREILKSVKFNQFSPCIYTKNAKVTFISTRLIKTFKHCSSCCHFIFVIVNINLIFRWFFWLNWFNCNFDGLVTFLRIMFVYTKILSVQLFWRLLDSNRLIYIEVLILGIQITSCSSWSDKG